MMTQADSVDPCPQWHGELRMSLPSQPARGSGASDDSPERRRADL